MDPQHPSSVGWGSCRAPSTGLRGLPLESQHGASARGPHVVSVLHRSRICHQKRDLQGRGHGHVCAVPQWAHMLRSSVPWRLCACFGGEGSAGTTHSSRLITACSAANLPPRGGAPAGRPGERAVAFAAPCGGRSHQGGLSRTQAQQPREAILHLWTLSERSRAPGGVSQQERCTTMAWLEGSPLGPTEQVTPCSSQT